MYLNHGLAELSGSLTVEERNATVLFQETSSQVIPNQNLVKKKQIDIK